MCSSAQAAHTTQPGHVPVDLRARTGRWMLAATSARGLRMPPVAPYLQADPGGDHGRLSHAWKECSWAAMGLRSLPAPGASRVHSLAMLSLRSVTLLWDLLALIFVRNDDLLGKS
jgi:hypothetical protein